MSAISSSDATTEPGPKPADGLLAWLGGMTLAGLSAFVPMSYDEAYWLGVAKMVESGRVLYEGALDNKTPPVYGLVWLIDALPGPYQLWRGVVVGLLALWIWRSLKALAAPESPTWRISFAVMAIALLAELQLATEFVAVGFLASGFASAYVRRQPTSAALLILAAGSFDPRTILLFPGIYLVVRSKSPRAATQLSVLLGAGAIIGAAFVLGVPRFRFALLELNLSSRFTELRPSPIQLLWQSLIPIAALAPLANRLDLRRLPGGCWVLGLGGLIIAFGSLLGIPHYWIYLVVPLVVAPIRPGIGQRTSVISMSLVLLSLVPAVASVSGAVTLHSGLEQRAIRVSEYLREVLEPGDTYVAFGAMPHLAVQMPEALAMSAPSSHYMAAGTSRSDRYRSELRAALVTASAIVEDGGLEVPREFVFEDHRGTRDVFDAFIGRFPCRTTIRTAIVHVRADRCQTP